MAIIEILKWNITPQVAPALFTSTWSLSVRCFSCSTKRWTPSNVDKSLGIPSTEPPFLVQFLNSSSDHVSLARSDKDFGSIRDVPSCDHLSKPLESKNELNRARGIISWLMRLTRDPPVTRQTLPFIDIKDAPSSGIWSASGSSTGANVWFKEIDGDVAERWEHKWEILSIFKPKLSTVPQLNH